MLYFFSWGHWQLSLGVWFWVHPEHGNEVATTSVLEVEMSHLGFLFPSGVFRGAQGPVLARDQSLQAVSYRHCPGDSLVFRAQKPKPEPAIWPDAGLDAREERPSLPRDQEEAAVGGWR